MNPINFLWKMHVRNSHSQSAYLDWLKDDLADCDSILELGCGAHSPILKIGYGYKTDAVDIWEPYVIEHNQDRDYRVCWKADILSMPFPKKAYDAVVICDVLEHLPREQVLKINLYGLMESCARKKVIIFIMNGFVENDLVDGDPFQEHVSAWEPEDHISRGYKVRGATGPRWILGKASLPKPPVFINTRLALWSQPFIYFVPEIAWHSYAVKELK